MKTNLSTIMLGVFCLSVSTSTLARTLTEIERNSICLSINSPRACGAAETTQCSLSNGTKTPCNIVDAIDPQDKTKRVFVGCCE